MSRSNSRAPSAALMSHEQLARIARIYGGVPLLCSLPDSPSARAGLRWGDIIVAVNGHPTPDAKAYDAAKRAREGSMTVRFVRDGAEDEVELRW